MSRLGLVLSGGGSRGAYEVGVLSYVLGDLARRHGSSPHFDVVAGTSVGAVNGAFLAATAEDYSRGVARLEGLWTDLDLSSVLRFGIRQAASLHRVLLGGVRPTGIFDAQPLASLVASKIPWHQLARNIRSGHLRALTVATTHVGTGRPVLFVDRARGVELPTGLPPAVIVRAAHILPHHVLASAAIPLVFPPIPIRGELYCDGGLRLNTPMAPAIHLGAERLLVVGVSTPVSRSRVALPHGRAPGASFLLGKVLNAFLLDHTNSDLGMVELINGFLDDGIQAFGDGFLERINAVAVARGHRPRGIIKTCAVRPSVDLGSIAGDHMRRHRLRFGRALGRSFLSLLDMGEGSDADLASYLMFDRDFAKALIDLGRRDAAAQSDQLEEFLFQM